MAEVSNQSVDPLRCYPQMLTQFDMFWAEKVLYRPLIREPIIGFIWNLAVRVSNGPWAMAEVSSQSVDPLRCYPQMLTQFDLFWAYKGLYRPLTREPIIGLRWNFGCPSSNGPWAMAEVSNQLVDPLRCYPQMLTQFDLLWAGKGLYRPLTQEPIIGFTWNFGCPSF